MQRRTRRTILGVALIAALVAGGAAFTASLGSNFPSGTVAGFGQDNITGATAAGVNYQITNDGQYVTEADIYFKPDVPSGATVKANFGDAANDGGLLSGTSVVTCTSQGLISGGTYDTDYEYKCNFAPSGNGVPVHDANYFNASVTKDDAHSTINGG
jgi:hypothetical protein